MTTWALDNLFSRDSQSSIAVPCATLTSNLHHTYQGKGGIESVAYGAVSFCAGPRQWRHESSGSGPPPKPWQRGRRGAAPPPAGRVFRRTRLASHHPYTHGGLRGRRSLRQAAGAEICSVTCRSSPCGVWCPAARLVEMRRGRHGSGRMKTFRFACRIPAPDTVPARGKPESPGAESGNASRWHNRCQVPEIFRTD